MNKSHIPKFIKSASTTISKHSPEILTVVGISGMIAGTVLAVKATPKALVLIKTAEKEKVEKQLKEDVSRKDVVVNLTPWEVVKTCWKCYIPSATTIAISTACLIGSNSVNARRNAALATAYKISETALTEYQEAVTEAVGEKKVQAIKEKVNQKQIDNTPVSDSQVYITGKGTTLCLEPLSHRYFESDIEKIRKAENDLNREMLHGLYGNASVNEFYDLIGLDRTDMGDSLGWNTEHLVDLNISAGLTDDDRPCLVIGHNHAPKWGY